VAGSKLRPKTGLQNYYPDIETLGKHYLVSSYGNDGETPHKKNGAISRRHYTISNCLRNKFYKPLVEMLVMNDDSHQDSRKSLNRSSTVFSMDLLNTEEVDSVNLTVKNYRMENGISTKIHDN
jgi:hypothetical protein